MFAGTLLSLAMDTMMQQHFNSMLVNSKILNYILAGRCQAVLGKMASFAEFIDSEKPEKGFRVQYTGGDYCTD